MRHLREVQILTKAHFGAWKGAVETIHSVLQDHFGWIPDWAPPSITIINKETGEQADESSIVAQYNAFISLFSPRD